MSAARAAAAARAMSAWVALAHALDAHDDAAAAHDTEQTTIDRPRAQHRARSDGARVRVSDASTVSRASRA